MLSWLLAIPLAWFLTLLFGYLVHKNLHNPLLGPFYRAHQYHHEVNYPADHFYSTTYLSSGKFSTVYLFLAAGIPLLFLPVLGWLLGFFSFTLMVVLLAEIGSIGLANNYLHDWFHIKNHIAHSIPYFGLLFSKWTQLHIIHHKDQSKNFGIFSFMFDKLFKTYQE
jgi:sterol desaturase/sphingolipid hydroxylase (fatty acid hydroxylase superfamily)